MLAARPATVTSAASRHFYQTTRCIVLPQGQVLAKIVATGADYVGQEALVHRACTIHKPELASITPPIGTCHLGDCEESLVYESGSFHLRLQ